KNPQQAFNKLSEIKIELSKGNDVFSIKSDKIDSLMTEYLSRCNDGYRKNSTATYNKHIKPIIGHLKIDKVTKDHLIKIRTNMEALKLSPNTVKKAKVILSPVFKEAFSDDVTRRNILELIKFGEDQPKPALVDRVAEPLIDAIKKIYNAALNEEANHRMAFLISIMCARRIGEILEIKYEDIVDGIVNVRAGTTKSYTKLHPDAVAERFPLPKEVLNTIGTGSGKVFKYNSRIYLDKYAQMIDTKCKLSLKALAIDYPIRTHDNRNFIISIQSRKYGMDFVGAACLSHSNRTSNMNARYHNIELVDIIRVYEDYWEKLRSKDSKTFTQMAVEEQLKELEDVNEYSI
ncbi:MAG: hypothetical protein B7Y30_11920, partial [Campylobacterales bacterium 16-40-21]